MDAQYCREQAERCRLLITIALKPEVKQQLRLWARELDGFADTIEVREQEPEYAEEDDLSDTCC
jgi:hypothetical protein